MAVFEPQFDAEHRELLRLCGELHDAIEQRAETSIVASLTRQLAADLEAHFSHEERLMSEQQLPGSEWHRKQHDYARHKLKELVEGEPGEVPAFIAEWVRDHAGLADRMMAASMRNARRTAQSQASKQAKSALRRSHSPQS